MKKEPVSISTLLMPEKAPMPMKAPRHAASADLSSERAKPGRGEQAPAGDFALLTLIATRLPRSDEVARRQARLLHVLQYQSPLIEREDRIHSLLNCMAHHVSEGRS